MQMTSWMTYWKMALLAGMAGALLAGGISLAIPLQYTCTSAMTVEWHGATPGQVQRALSAATLKILARENLAELVRDPKLDLYRKERQRYSVEKIAEGIFRNHLLVEPYASFGANSQAFRVVFSYPDRFKAKAVVDRLTVAFLREFLRTPGGPAIGSVLENAMLPERPASPSRPWIVTLGLIAGVLTGVLSVAIFRHTRYAVVTVDIPRDAKRFVDSQVAAGRYRSAGDYVRELILADEQRRR